MRASGPDAAWPVRRGGLNRSAVGSRPASFRQSARHDNPRMSVDSFAVHSH
jgi:hypothetical protein